MGFVTLLGNSFGAVGCSVLAVTFALQLLRLEQNCGIINLRRLFQSQHWRFCLRKLLIIVSLLYNLGVIHIFLVVGHRWLCNRLQLRLICGITYSKTGLILIICLFRIRVVVQVDASRILLALDLRLSRLIINELILSIRTLLIQF